MPKLHDEQLLRIVFAPVIAVMYGIRQFAVLLVF